MSGKGGTDLFVQVHHASITLSIDSPLHEGIDKPLELVEGLGADLLQVFIHSGYERQGDFMLSITVSFDDLRTSRSSSKLGC